MKASVKLPSPSQAAEADPRFSVEQCSPPERLSTFRIPSPLLYHKRSREQLLAGTSDDEAFAQSASDLSSTHDPETLECRFGNHTASDEQSSSTHQSDPDCLVFPKLSVRGYISDPSVLSEQLHKRSFTDDDSIETDVAWRRFENALSKPQPGSQPGLRILPAAINSSVQSLTGLSVCPTPSCLAMVPSPLYSHQHQHFGWWRGIQELARRNQSCASVGKAPFGTGLEVDRAPQMRGWLRDFGHEGTHRPECPYAIGHTSPLLVGLVADMDSGRIQQLNDAVATSSGPHQLQHDLLGLSTPLQLPHDEPGDEAISSAGIESPASLVKAEDERYFMFEDMEADELQTTQVVEMEELDEWDLILEMEERKT